MQLNDTIDRFMSDIHRGEDPTNRFHAVLNMSEQHNGKGYSMVNKEDEIISMYDEQIFGNNTNYSQYPVVTTQPQINYNSYNQPQYYQNTNPKRTNLNLPLEIVESLENQPVDDNVFRVNMSDNSNVEFYNQNTRMDLLNTTPNPYNPQNKQMLYEQQYQNNISNQGIPINQSQPIQQYQYNSKPIDITKLVEQIQKINDKLGIKENNIIKSPEINNFITLNFNNKNYKGVIKQEKNKQNRIIFLLEDGIHYIELIPGKFYKKKTK